MNVLHLNTHASGGSYEYAALLSTALADHGIESRVLCKSASPASRPLLDRVIRRTYVSLSNEPWHGTRRLVSPPSPEDLKEVDIVHLHTVADWFNVPNWLERLPTGIAVVVTLHDMWHLSGGCFLYRGCDLHTSTCTPCPVVKPPFNRVLAKDEQKRKLRAYARRRAQFVASSQWLAWIAERSQIVKASGGVRVIPVGIDTAVFKPQDKSLFRKQMGLPANAFVIVTGATSLNDTNKNVPWLFKELAHLPDLQNVVVLAFGERSVPVPAGLNVRFTGGIRDRNELAQLFAVADVFVSASLMETYGLTLVEAMACGTPVIAFRVGGIPEAAPHGEGAILCPPQDGPALIQAIVKLRDSPQLREKLGEIGHKRAFRCNAATAFATRFAQVYQESVLSHRNVKPDQAALVT